MSCPHFFSTSEIKEYEHCIRCGTYHSIAAKPPEDLYAKDYWDGDKRSTVRDQDFNISKHMEAGVTKMEFIRHRIWQQDLSAALEIGCAPGTLLRMLNDVGFDRIVGIDVDSDCEADIRETSGVDAELIFGLFPAITVSLKPEQFSLLLASDVFEHIHEPQSFLKECFRLLKPDGQMLLMTPLVDGEHPLPARFFEPTEHVWMHSKTNISELLTDAGFVNPRYDRWTDGHDTVTVRRP